MEIRINDSLYSHKAEKLTAALSSGHLTVWRERDILVCQADRIQSDMPQCFAEDLLIDGTRLADMPHILIEVMATTSSSQAGVRQIDRWHASASFKDPAALWRPHQATSRLIHSEALQGHPDSATLAQALERCHAAVAADTLEPVHVMLDRLQDKHSFSYRDVQVNFWSDGHGGGNYVFLPAIDKRISGASWQANTPEAARKAIERAYRLVEIPHWGMEAAIAAGLSVGDVLVMSRHYSQGGEIARIVWQANDLRVIQYENGGLRLYAGTEPTGHIGGVAETPEGFVSRVIDQERMRASANAAACRDAALEGHEPLIL